MRFIAAFTSSKKAETISPESLRIKFYSADEKTQNEIKEVIINLLNFVNRPKAL
jgi:hypothetical protein